MAIERQDTDAPRSIFGWISLTSSLRKQFKTGQIDKATYDKEITKIKESADESLQRSDRSVTENFCYWAVHLIIEIFD